MKLTAYRIIVSGVSLVTAASFWSGVSPSHSARSE